METIKTEIAGYGVEIFETENGVDCHVTSKCGQFTNSLGLLMDLGEFDDGPRIPESVTDRIATFAERHGY